MGTSIVHSHHSTSPSFTNHLPPLPVGVVLVAIYNCCRLEDIHSRRRHPSTPPHCWRLCSPSVFINLSSTPRDATVKARRTQTVKLDVPRTTRFSPKNKNMFASLVFDFFSCSNMKLKVIVAKKNSLFYWNLVFNPTENTPYCLNLFMNVLIIISCFLMLLEIQNIAENSISCLNFLLNVVENQYILM